MRSITAVASLLLLANGIVAQYGGGYGSGSSPDDNSGTPISSVDDNSGTPVSSSSAAGSVAPTSLSVPPTSSILPSTPSIKPPTAPNPPTVPTSEASIPDGVIEVHSIKVSNKNGNLTFEPNNLEAKPGSLVQFQFYPKNHSVVESTFDKPCTPINNVNKSIPGFFSGYIPVKKGDSTRPTFTILINDTKPIWYYCSQSDHCNDGMVGVINAPAKNKSRTITTFSELAKKAEIVSPSIDAGDGGSASKNSGSSSDGSSSSSSAVPVSAASTGSSHLAGTGTGTIIKPTSSTNATSATFTGAANALTGKQGVLGGAGLGMIGLIAAFAL